MLRDKAWPDVGTTAAGSVAALWAVHARWPQGVSNDVSYALFAAQHFAATGRLAGVEPNSPFSGDLGALGLSWITTWPPAVSLWLSACLLTGVSPGIAARITALACLLLAALGWAGFCRRAGASVRAATFVAAATPWLSFEALSLSVLYNDHVLLALTPWVYCVLLDAARRRSEGSALFAGLLTGLLVAVKLSSIPVAAGAAVWWWLADRRPMSEKWRLQSCLWLGLALLPGTVLIANKDLAGAGSAVARDGWQLSFSTLGAAQLWNLAGPPMGELVGWPRLAGAAAGQPLVKAATGLLGIAIWAFGYVSLGKRRVSRTSVMLSVLTLCLWGFLSLLNAALVFPFDWTSEARYYYPVYLGWLALFAASSLDGLSTRTSVMAAALIALPVALGATAAVAKAAAKDPPPVMPRSRLALHGLREPRAAAQLLSAATSGRRAPDILICDVPQPMNELERPVLAWVYASGPSKLYASRRVEAWALLDEAQTSRLRELAGPSATLTVLGTAQPWVLSRLRLGL